MNESSPSFPLVTLPTDAVIPLQDAPPLQDGERDVKMPDGNYLRVRQASCLVSLMGRTIERLARPEPEAFVEEVEGQLGPTKEYYEMLLLAGMWVDSKNGFEKRVRDPFVIDTLRRRNVIDGMQHHYAIRFKVLWHQAGRPSYRSSLSGDESRGTPNALEAAMVEQITRRDEYFKVISKLSTRHYQFIYLVCVDEVGLYDAARLMGIPVRNAGVDFRDALDCLGYVFEMIAEIKEQMEKANPPV